MASLDQVKVQIRFALEQLSSRNAHHVFEDLCRNLGRARICSNILPATGPVSAGGDQGRDFETFRSYLLSTPIATSTFVGLALAKPVAFACSLDKRYLTKVKADVALIMAGGAPVESIHCFSTKDIPVAQRHKLQAWARDRYAVHLELYDANAISELLSDAEVFWIATRFLDIPSEIFPRPAKEEPSSWYPEALRTWSNRTARMNDAGFVSVKAATRYATDHAKADLPIWIGVLEEFTKRYPTEFRRRQARYEILVAALKGFDNLFGHEESLREYFSAIPELDDTAAVEDACVLVNMCIGASLLDKVELTTEEIQKWHSQLRELIESQITAAPSTNLECRWLELAGYVAMSVDPVLREKPNLGDAIRRWFELISKVHDAPLFPLEEFADRLTKYSLFIGDHPRYDELAHRVDQLLSDRFGGFVAAEKCRDRALIFYENGDILRAIHELHRAKFQWFAEETLEAALLAILLLANCYRRLKLTWAAKYYALAAGFIAMNAERHRMRQKLPGALISAAECDYTEGAWTGCLELTETALRMHVHVSDAVGDLGKHPEFQTVAHYTTLLMTLTERLDASLFGFVAQTVHAWGFGKLLDEMFAAGRQALSDLDRGELWALTTKQLAGRPFGDLGEERTTSWSQLGVTWVFRWKNSYDTTAIAEEFVAILQIALAEFAGRDLALLKTSVRIRIELAVTGKIKAEALASNEGRDWTVLIPSDSLVRYSDVDQYQIEALIAVVLIIREISLLPDEEFHKQLLTAWEDGMTHKTFIAQRYEKIYRQFVPAWLFQRAERMSRRVPEAQRPFAPVASSEMTWFDGRPAEYTESDSIERIQSRYNKTIPALRFTLQRLKRTTSFMITVNELRKAEWKDWHILLAIFNVVLNWRMNILFELPREIKRVQSYAHEASEHPESENAPVVPLTEFTSESLDNCLKLSMLSTVDRLGLELHQETPDFDAISTFLGSRYGYWTLDVPHEDPFS